MTNCIRCCAGFDNVWTSWEVHISGLPASQDMWMKLGNEGGLPSLRKLVLCERRKVHIDYYEKELGYDGDEETWYLSDEDNPESVYDPEIEASTVAHLLQQCPNLEIIKLEGLHLSNPLIFEALGSLNKLYDLDLSGCSGFYGSFRFSTRAS